MLIFYILHVHAGVGDTAVAAVTGKLEAEAERLAELVAVMEDREEQLVGEVSYHPTIYCLSVYQLYIYLHIYPGAGRAGGPEAGRGSAGGDGAAPRGGGQRGGAHEEGAAAHRGLRGHQRRHEGMHHALDVYEYIL